MLTSASQLLGSGPLGVYAAAAAARAGSAASNGDGRHGSAAALSDGGESQAHGSAGELARARAAAGEHI